MTENKGTIVIVCSGSRGDVQPFIPIAMRLKRYGYGVNFIAYESFRTFLKSYGFTDEEFTPFVGSMVEALQSKEGQEALARGDMMGIMKIVQKLLPFQPRNDDIMIEACSKSDVKALLCSTVVLNQCGAIAEKFKLPFFQALAAPMHESDSYLPIFFSSYRSNWKIINRLVHSVLGKLMFFMGKGTLNKLRVDKLGLNSMTKNENLIEPFPTFYLWSKEFLPACPTWGTNIMITGYPQLTREDVPEFEPTQALTTFLASGDEPIYLGFGSMPILNAHTTIKIASNALKTLGLRGVICAGWSDVEDSEIPDHICLIKEAPHDWLFPKCKAIVHHGGAGTTGSAVLAGKPMVVFPVIADQTWWASLAASRGVSPTTIVPFPKLTEETLVNGLTFAIQDEPVRKARELGEKVRAEQNGADFIADYMVTAIENGTAYIPHVGKQRSSLLRVVVATSIVVAASVGALYVYKEHKAQNVRYGLIDGTIAAVRGTLR